MQTLELRGLGEELRRDSLILDLLPGGVMIHRAGRALYANPAFLAQVGAELYRFDLDLVSAGGDRWQVKGATWAPARPDDFVGK